MKNTCFFLTWFLALLLALTLLTSRAALPQQAVERSREQHALELLKHLPPYSALDAVLELDRVTDPEIGRRVTESLRPAVQGPEDPIAARRFLYLEGRLIQCAGNYRGAADKFGKLKLRAIDAARYEPVLRYGECLRAAGDPQAAEHALREVLAQGSFEHKALWDLWAAISLSDLHLPPADLLSSLPGPSGYPEDLQWLFERLARGETIRIRAGDEDFNAPDGTSWGRDRFSNGGNHAKASFGEISGTDSDPLYHGQRYFPEAIVKRVGYQVPLPPGTYRVTLYFAEVYAREPRRTFDVRIEEKDAITDYSPLAVGFATADERSADVHVVDGLLNIEFVPKVDAPTVSALEIRRAE